MQRYGNEEGWYRLASGGQRLKVLPGVRIPRLEDNASSGFHVLVIR